MIMIRNENPKIRKLSAFILGDIPIFNIEKSLIGSVSCPTPDRKKLIKKSSRLIKKQSKKLLKIEFLRKGKRICLRIKAELAPKSRAASSKVTSIFFIWAERIKKAKESVKVVCPTMTVTSPNGQLIRTKRDKEDKAKTISGNESETNMRRSKNLFGFIFKTTSRASATESALEMRAIRELSFKADQKEGS